MLNGSSGNTTLVEAFCKRPFLLTAIFLALMGYMVICIKKGNDFLAFYDLGKMSLEKVGHVYDPTPSTGMWVFYLPHFSLLMMPWALMPFSISAGLWFWFKLGLLTQITRLFSLWSSRCSKRERILHVALPLLVCTNFLNNDFRLGQVNLIVHALMIFSFVTLLARKHMLSSFLFVLSSFKVTPLAVLPYFIIRKQWKFLFGVAGWTAVFSVLLIVWFGWEEVASFPLQWLEVSQSHKLGLLYSAGVKNQSLFGVIARFATDIVGGSDANNFLQLKTEPINPTSYKLITYGMCFLLMGVICSWILLRKPVALNLTEFSVFLVMMLLISPDTRTAHMVHLLLPAYLLVSSVQWGSISVQDHWWFLIICTVFLGTSRDLIGRTAYNYAFYFSSHTIVMSLFLVLLVRHCHQAGITDRAIRSIQNEDRA